MTKKKLDALLEWLDKLGLGASGGDEVRKPQQTRSDAPPFASVISAPLCRTQR